MRRLPPLEGKPLPGRNRERSTYTDGTPEEAGGVSHTQARPMSQAAE